MNDGVWWVGVWCSPRSPPVFLNRGRTNDRLTGNSPEDGVIALELAREDPR